MVCCGQTPAATGVKWVDGPPGRRFIAVYPGTTTTFVPLGYPYPLNRAHACLLPLPAPSPRLSPRPTPPPRPTGAIQSPHLHPHPRPLYLIRHITHAQRFFPTPHIDPCFRTLCPRVSHPLSPAATSLQCGQNSRSFFVLGKKNDPQHIACQARSAPTRGRGALRRLEWQFF